MWTPLRILGIALIVAGSVLFGLFSSGALLVATTGPYAVVSMFYDPANKLWTGSLTLFSGGQPSELAQFVASDSTKASLKVDMEPVTLSARVKSQYIDYLFVRSFYANKPVCYTVTGSDAVGVLLNVDDIAGALRDAEQKFASMYGKPPSQYFSDYRAFITKVWTEGGLFNWERTLYADVTFCGYVKDAYAFYAPQTGVYRPRATIEVSLRNSKGVVAGPVELSTESTGKVSFGSYGYVQFLGAKLLSGDLTAYAPQCSYLYMVPGSTTVYCVPLSNASVVDYIRTVSTRYATTLAQVGSSNVQAIVSEDPRAVLLDCDGVSYCTPDPYSGTYQTILQLAQQYSSYQSQLGASPLSTVEYKISASSDQIQVTKNVMDKSLYSYDLRFALTTQFAGIKYLRADPKIVDFSVSDCTDMKAIVNYTIRNASDESGSVVVTITSQYHGSVQRSYVLGPGQSVTDTVVLSAAGAPEQNFTDTFTIKAEAWHPLEPASDSRTVTSQCTVEYRCSIPDILCQQDENGAWYYLTCVAPDKPPERVYCTSGQVCVNGKGCVVDAIEKVECTSDRSGYVVYYKYSGKVVSACRPGTQCDVNYAEAGKVPPCVEVNGWVPPPPPPPGGVSAKMDARAVMTLPVGMILAGIGLLLVG